MSQMRGARPPRSFPRALRRVAALSLALTAATGVLAAAPASAEPGSVVVRIDQVGYMPDEPKRAYALADQDLSGRTFAVRDGRGRAVLRGALGAEDDRGVWSPRYDHVFELDFTALRTEGRFTIEIEGDQGAARSAPFEIATSSDLFAPVVDSVAGFFTSQRDGYDVVPGALGRRPSHVEDVSATVYRSAGLFPDPESETPSRLVPLLDEDGEQIRRDVSGGWFDAGDYLKFVQTSSYAVVLLSIAEQSWAPSQAISSEIDHGLEWLDRMWDDESGVLHHQVGIGTGNSDLGFVGDHDVWRLPEEDDDPSIAREDVPGTGDGREEYFLKFRPVFASNAPGDPLSPNLAGRVAGAFALAAQREHEAGHAASASGWFAKAVHVYNLADVDWKGQLVTTEPFSYYPEQGHHDDLALAAAELSRAALALGDADRARTFAAEGIAFASRSEGDVLNLYDTSALADAELVEAVRALASSGHALARSDDIEADLLAGVEQSGIEESAEFADADPFSAVADPAQWDVVSRTFGSLAVAGLVKRITGRDDPSRVASGARNWAFGANAWGLSFVIGTGEDFPRCPHHQIASLIATPGSGMSLEGAVVNGPNASARTKPDDGRWWSPGAVADCPADRVDRLRAFHSPASEEFGPEQGYRGTRFLDGSGAWATSEPGIDFAATAVLALSLEMGTDTNRPTTPSSAPSPGSTDGSARSAPAGSEGSALAGAGGTVCGALLVAAALLLLGGAGATVIVVRRSRRRTLAQIDHLS